MREKRLSVMGRFLATVDENRLLSRGDRVLVALSGGADSTALLELLLAAARRLGITVCVFHLNHGLRRAAAGDEAAVRRLCRERGVDLVVERADVAAHARKQRLGVEEAGRELRYRLLDEAADRLDCVRVALGHNANDNLETMLMNLVRGTGPAGLCGIPVRRGRFVRPLLDIERGDLERFLSARGTAWIEDESNRDSTFRRNRLRTEVLPVLVALNGAAVQNARRTARLLANESAYLDGLADEFACAGSRIDTLKLATYNDCLKRRIVKRLLPELDSGGVESLLEFAARAKRGRLELSGGVRCRFSRGVMEFERTEETNRNG